MENIENDIEYQISKFKDLQNNRIEYNNKNNTSIMSELAEKLIEITRDTYNKMAEKYSEVRTMELLEFDKKVWNKLLNYVNKYLDEDYKKLKLLDIGAGHGRDLKYAFDIGFNAIGVDNSEKFIDCLKELAINNLIPNNTFVKADMRELPFENESFDIVRQQATLLHFPIVDKGYTVDKALEESYRVLKKNGLLYVLVKKGEGIEYVDTNEGLGGRIFQFYNEKIISDLVERNGFKIISVTDEEENRKGKIVEWIMVIAQK